VSPAPSPPSPAVEMRGVHKRFGETTALAGVDFVARAGEIHGLLGENGAGKTTLMNILSGLYRADRGETRIAGQPTVIRSPADGLGHGIGMVHQHVELVDTFTALENVLLGREGARLWLSLERHREAVERAARRFGLSVDLDTEVRRLAVGVQQKVEILKALYRGVKILVLDEPTTMLTPREVDALFRTIRAVAEEGVAVVFITHKIREILANCDRMTVMRGGRAVGTVERAAADEDRLVEMMIGERLAGAVLADQPPRGRRPAPALLAVRELAVTGDQTTRVVEGCTFTVAAGELVGLAGVAGNGQRDLAEALVGLRPAAAGAVTVAGRDVTRMLVRERLAAGLVYIPEDRIRDGVLPGLSLAENFVLGLHAHLGAGRVFFDRATARGLARAAMTEYSVVAPDEHALAIALSGGNIQKLLVARAMTLARVSRASALVAMNPTRGLDVRAADFVRRRLLDFARAGGAVLLISEDLDELQQVSHRMLVMYRGRLVADLERAAFDPYRIGALMAGARDGGTSAPADARGSA